MSEPAGLPPTPMENGAGQPGEVARIVLIYATFATLWILFSDRLTGALFHNVEDLVLASIIKGLAFVLATSMLLYWLMSSRLARAGPGHDTTSPHGRPILAALALGMVILCGGAMYQALLQNKATAAARLQTISDLITRRIADWLGERMGDAAFLHTSPFFSENFERGWLGRQEAASRLLMQSRLEEFVADNGFTAAMLLGPGGERLWGSRLAPRQVNATLAREARLAARN
ncbi:MAG TPA: hypothetical protein PK437_10510, partial [Thiobacillaceae bacterium]|nr:hypothetical protein [Thiobacillaceae bacterium]